MSNKQVRVERTIAGKQIVLETGLVAKQAGGAIIATLGGTKVFAAATSGGARDDIDFFPLVCDYREKTEAAGKIPGGFFKREGRPTTKEILTMRLIDRSIRPMFPDGFRQEVQVMTHALAYDGENNSDVLAMIAAFAAVRISGIPFERSLGAVRVAYVDGKLQAFPTDADRRGESKLDLIVAGHGDGIAMVESSAKELPEDVMVDALEFGHDIIKEVVDMVDELHSKAGKPVAEFTTPEVNQDLRSRVMEWKGRIADALHTEGKHERDAAVRGVREQCIEAIAGSIHDGGERACVTKEVKGFFSEASKYAERTTILSGARVDGRKWDEIRHIDIRPGFVERQHGSVLFTRGETQALVSATLGTPDDEQVIDGIEEEYKKHFYLHYNFPAYSVGETRRIMGPGRREIGHGMLAERSLTPVLPAKESFPYTIRIVSDIMESNGSSSMASVCGGCLAMMVAGVPLSQPVAGIAMGLVQEDGKTAILSDILGSEDHNGDMDFKVAGSGVGITALQMDIKIKGVSRDLLSAALEQARVGRIHILRKMLEAVPSPSADISDFAPRMETLKIPAEKIGFLIGPGGRNIKAMQEQYKVRISILDDQGNVQVFGIISAQVKACAKGILAMCETPRIGTRYMGTVRSVRDFGAFIEILPGVEGLCHISDLADGYVGQVSDEVEVGDEVEVEVINVDDRGKVKVSRKAVLAGSGGGDGGDDDDEPRNGGGRDGGGRDGDSRGRRERSGAGRGR